MTKAGRILLFVMAILAFTGAINKTFAQDKKTSTLSVPLNCSSSMVSTPTCRPGLDVCSKPITSNQPRQIQSAVVAAAPTVTQSQPEITQAPAAPLPSMAPLNSQMASDSALLDSDKIFNLINQYRSSLGKVVFEKEDSVCSLAKTRSIEIAAEIQNGTLHSGLYNRNLPYWIWENAKYGSNEEGTVAWWLASPVHHQSIVGDYKYSCVQCTGSYCSELFTSFIPK